jgi:hypothetical protein
MGERFGRRIPECIRGGVTEILSQYTAQLSIQLTIHGYQYAKLARHQFAENNSIIWHQNYCDRTGPYFFLVHNTRFTNRFQFSLPSASNKEILIKHNFSYPHKITKKTDITAQPEHSTPHSPASTPIMNIRNPIQLQEAILFLLFSDSAANRFCAASWCISICRAMNEKSGDVVIISTELGKRTDRCDFWVCRGVEHDRIAILRKAMKE